MGITINPTTSLNGEIIAPGSKSYSHRAFIAASLADGVSIVKNPLSSGDVKVTLSILKALKVNIIEETKDSYLIQKSLDSFKSIKKPLDCKNSGTSIRIFSALSLRIKGGLSFTGEFLKRKRPIIPLLDALKYLGGEYEINEDLIKIKRSKPQCNTVKIRGDISSQFITALLFVSPLLKCDNKDWIEIELTTPLVSYPFVRITLDVLNSFGIYIQEQLNEQKLGKYIITCGQRYRPQIYEIPGDFSSASFIITAAILSPEDSTITIKNLEYEKGLQGDKKIIEILRGMGANIEIMQNQIIIKGNISKYPLKGVKVDCSEIPDLFPILSVCGAFAKGRTELYNASNLRLKESDRISVMSRELVKMGVKVKEKKDRLIIYHSKNIKGSLINHENDHRVAMACCIGALFAKSSSQIHNVKIVKDSYPNFINDLKKLGANIVER